MVKESEFDGHLGIRDEGMYPNTHNSILKVTMTIPNIQEKRETKNQKTITVSPPQYA
jgi:hypothetical protein